MSADKSSDELSIIQGGPRVFDTALRGYDRRQVDEMIGNLEDETRAFAVERETLRARLHDLTLQLDNGFAQIESMRRQLHAASAEINASNVDARVRDIIDAAHAGAVKARAEGDAYLQQMRLVADDAAERHRATARAEAEEILQDATRRLAEADETFRIRIAEADRYRFEINEHAERTVTAAREQELQLTAEAAAERARLDAQSRTEREQLGAETAAAAELARTDSQGRVRTAEHDFEMVLRERRNTEADRSAQQLRAAQEEAARIMGLAQEQAQQLDVAARANVAGSQATAIGIRQQADEYAGLTRADDAVSPLRPQPPGTGGSGA